MAEFSELSYSAVLLAVLAQQLCLPVPSPVFLMAAGALSAQGEMHTGIIVFLGLSGCLVGDGIWFWFGRRWGSQAMRLVCRLSSDPQKFSRNAREKFSHYGLALLCVGRFLPGFAVLPPLAAAEGVSLARFLAWDVLGGSVWSGAYVALGYVFSNEVDFVIRWVRHFGTFVSIAIGVPLAFYAGWRGLVLLRMIRRLRLRRISPPMLEGKMKSKSKVAILDLLEFEEEIGGKSPEAIPGALRVDPARLRESPHLAIPDDVDIVLYSSAGGDTLSARVAVALKRIGVDKVWVLEGGLKAWREQGFPVAQSPDPLEVVAQRLGIDQPQLRELQHRRV